MATQQLLIRLPEELVRRLKQRVAPRARSAFIKRLLEQALPPGEGEDDPLYQAALAVEADAALAAEMAEWDVTVGDGLISWPPSPRPPVVIAAPSAGDASVAVCDQLRAVDKSRLAQRLGQLTAADLRAVEAGVRAVLEL